MPLEIDQLSASISVDDSNVRYVLDRVNAQFDDFIRKINDAGRASVEAANASGQAWQSFSEKMEGVRTKIQGAASELRALSTSAIRFGRDLTFGLTLPIVELGKFALGFDDIKNRAAIAFDTIYRGNTKLARDMVEQIQTFSLKTPLQYTDLLAQAQMFTVFGVSAQKLIPTLKAVNDALTVRTLDPTRLRNISIDLGELLTEGTAQMRQLRGIATVVPVFDMLADAYTKATGKVTTSSIEAKKVGGDPLVGLLELMAQKYEKVNGKAMTASEMMKLVRSGAVEGKWAFQAIIQQMEMFAPDHMLKAMNSLPGALTNIKLAAQIALGDIFKPVYDSSVKWLRATSGELMDWGRQLAALPQDIKDKIIGIGAALAAIGPTILGLGTLSKIGMFLANPIAGTATLGIAGLTYYFISNRKAAEELGNYLQSHLTEIMGDLGNVFKAVENIGKDLAPVFVSILEASIPFLNTIGKIADVFNSMPSALQSTIVYMSALAGIMAKMGGVRGIRGGGGGILDSEVMLPAEIAAMQGVERMPFIPAPFQGYRQVEEIPFRPALPPVSAEAERIPFPIGGEAIGAVPGGIQGVVSAQGIERIQEADRDLQNLVEQFRITEATEVEFSENFLAGMIVIPGAVEKVVAAMKLIPASMASEIIPELTLFETAWASGVASFEAGAMSMQATMATAGANIGATLVGIATAVTFNLGRAAGAFAAFAATPFGRIALAAAATAGAVEMTQQAGGIQGFLEQHTPDWMRTGINKMGGIPTLSNQFIQPRTDAQIAQDKAADAAAAKWQAVHQAAGTAGGPVNDIIDNIGDGLHKVEDYGATLVIRVAKNQEEALKLSQEALERHDAGSARIYKNSMSLITDTLATINPDLVAALRTAGLLTGSVGKSAAAFQAQADKMRSMGIPVFQPGKGFQPQPGDILFGKGGAGIAGGGQYNAYQAQLDALDPGKFVPMVDKAKDALEKAYNREIERLKEDIALQRKDKEAFAVSYETKIGRFKDLDVQQKEYMNTLAGISMQQQNQMKTDKENKKQDNKLQQETAAEVQQSFHTIGEAYKTAIENSMTLKDATQAETLASRMHMVSLMGMNAEQRKRALGLEHEAIVLQRLTDIRAADLKVQEQTNMAGLSRRQREIIGAAGGLPQWREMGRVPGQQGIFEMIWGAGQHVEAASSTRDLLADINREIGMLGNTAETTAMQASGGAYAWDKYTEGEKDARIQAINLKAELESLLSTNKGLEQEVWGLENRYASAGQKIREQMTVMRREHGWAGPVSPEQERAFQDQMDSLGMYSDQVDQLTSSNKIDDWKREMSQMISDLGYEMSTMYDPAIAASNKWEESNFVVLQEMRNELGMDEGYWEQYVRYFRDRTAQVEDMTSKLQAQKQMQGEMTQAISGYMQQGAPQGSFEQWLAGRGVFEYRGGQMQMKPGYDLKGLRGQYDQLQGFEKGFGLPAQNQSYQDLAKKQMQLQEHSPFDRWIDGFKVWDTSLKQWVIPKNFNMFEALLQYGWDRSMKAAERWQAQMVDIGQATADTLRDSIGALFQTGMKGFFQTMVGDFERALQQMAVKWAVFKIMTALGGAIGGQLGDIFSGIGQAQYGGGKAGGGEVEPGMGYLVGEKGPEMLYPTSRGYIQPNGGGGQEFHFHFNGPTDRNSVLRAKSQIENEFGKSMIRQTRRG